MRVALVYCSRSQGNTAQVVRALTGRYAFDAVLPVEDAFGADVDLAGFDLVVLASGIYFGYADKRVRRIARERLAPAPQAPPQPLRALSRFPRFPARSVRLSPRRPHRPPGSFAFPARSVHLFPLVLQNRVDPQRFFSLVRRKSARQRHSGSGFGPSGGFAATRTRPQSLRIDWILHASAL